MSTVAHETDTAPEVAAWAASGAMALTGRPDGPPLGPPAGFVPMLQGVGDLIGERSAALGRKVAVDPLALLAERAAISGLHRQGATSCGGASRLLPTADGWLAVSFARADDVDLVPAWLRAVPDAGDDLWSGVASAVRRVSGAALVERGALLGLPVSLLGETGRPPCSPAPLAPLPLRATPFGAAPPMQSLAGVRVVDLSSLWAGPLCGSLLAAAGADVVKVESASRPDGARLGPPAFFDLLNASKRSVVLDLRTQSGLQALRALLLAADVVIEASRPRALEQLGIVAGEALAGGCAAVWASITGHGRQAAPQRVAFGDDAAVAGGLVAWDAEGPCFCADAVADPTTGLVTAAAVLDALTTGGRWLLDVSLAGVAAHLTGPTLPVPAGTTAMVPPPRTASGAAAPLGTHTDDVLSELELA